jgi:hypothetical protein
MSEIKQHRWRFCLGVAAPISFMCAFWWANEMPPVGQIPQPLLTVAWIVFVVLLLGVPCTCFVIGFTLDFDNKPTTPAAPNGSRL